MIPIFRVLRGVKANQDEPLERWICGTKHGDFIRATKQAAAVFGNYRRRLVDDVCFGSRGVGYFVFCPSGDWRRHIFNSSHRSPNDAAGGSPHTSGGSPSNEDSKYSCVEGSRVGACSRVEAT